MFRYVYTFLSRQQTYFFCGFSWPSPSNNIISRCSLCKETKHFFLTKIIPLMIEKNYFLSTEWLRHLIKIVPNLVCNVIKQHGGHNNFTNHMYYMYFSFFPYFKSLIWQSCNDKLHDSYSLYTVPLVKLRGTAENCPVPPPWRKRTL